MSENSISRNDSELFGMGCHNLSKTVGRERMVSMDQNGPESTHHYQNDTNLYIKMGHILFKSTALFNDILYLPEQRAEPRC